MWSKQRAARRTDNATEAPAAAAIDLHASAGAGPTAEDLAWLESDLSGLGEYGPYDWGEEGPPAGEPVRYDPERCFVVIHAGEPDG